MHDLRGLCGELIVEANGTEAEMIERIVAARLDKSQPQRQTRQPNRIRATGKRQYEWRSAGGEVHRVHKAAARKTVTKVGT